ncbi:hypothetical protein [Solicola sp. PLA-1-18]|uniref:hypothetical protein n=1 Tax=Solicola sp. PLA-1-18 TaxID=3380532 RepID=UPI003B777588
MDVSAWVLDDGDEVVVGGRVSADGLRLAPTADPRMREPEPYWDLGIDLAPAASPGLVTVTGRWDGRGLSGVSAGPLAGPSGFTFEVGTGVRLFDGTVGPPKQRDVDRVQEVLDAEASACGLAMTGETVGVDGRPRVVAWLRQVTPALAERLVGCHPTVLALDVWLRPGASPGA